MPIRPIGGFLSERQIEKENGNASASPNSHENTQGNVNEEDPSVIGIGEHLREMLNTETDNELGNTDDENERGKIFFFIHELSNYTTW